MRETRMGKRISVQGVPLDTSWFCPYCCATVDTSSVTWIAVLKVERILKRCRQQVSGPLSPQAGPQWLSWRRHYLLCPVPPDCDKRTNREM